MSCCRITGFVIVTLLFFITAFNTYNAWFVIQLSDEDFIDDIFHIRNRIFKEYPVGHTKRDSHAKAPATVKGFFEVLTNLSQEYQVGIFAIPGKSYPAWFRVSNARFGKQGPDIEPDPRGFAIKLLDDKGEHPIGQDLILLSAPRTPFGLVRNFKELALARREGTNFQFFLNLLLTGRGMDIIWLILNFNNDVFGSLFDTPYYGCTPYRFGPDRVVKYVIKPTSFYRSPPPNKTTTDPDFLTKRMKEHLSQAEVTYDFFVMFQLDRDKQPIDDMSPIWREQDTYPVKIATIRIPPQEVDQEAPIGEALTFNPGSAWPDHMPVGRVNRVRNGVYWKMKKMRFERDNRKPFA